MVCVSMKALVFLSLLVATEVSSFAVLQVRDVRTGDVVRNFAQKDFLEIRNVLGNFSSDINIYTVEASTSPTIVRRVEFSLDGALYHVAREYPYTINGLSETNDFIAWEIPEGNYKLEARVIFIEELQEETLFCELVVVNQAPMTFTAFGRDVSCHTESCIKGSFNTLETNDPVVLSRTLVEIEDTDPFTKSMGGIRVSNIGSSEIFISQIKFNSITEGDGNVWKLHIATKTIRSGQTSSVGVWLKPQANIPLLVQFSPSLKGKYRGCGSLSFQGLPGKSFCFQGTAAPPDDFHTLHPVLDIPFYVIDWDNNNFEGVLLDGSPSHTHESGASLTEFRFYVDFERVDPLAKKIDDDVMGYKFALGMHTVELEVVDTNGKTLRAFRTLIVVKPDDVPVIILRIYKSENPNVEMQSITPKDFSRDLIRYLLNNLEVSYANIEPSARVTSNSFGFIGSSRIENNAIIHFHTNIVVINPLVTALQLQHSNGLTCKVFQNGAEVTSTLNKLRSFGVGSYKIDALCAMDKEDKHLTMELHFDDELITQEQTLFSNWRISTAVQQHLQKNPFINSIDPPQGATNGEFTVQINGVGLYGSSVIWGNMKITNFLKKEFIKLIFKAPAGNPGTIKVSTVSSWGSSNDVSFTYLSTKMIQPKFFISAIAGTSMDRPTQACWSRDGRLFVGSQVGIVHVFSFSDSYEITSAGKITTLQKSSNNAKTILGIAFSPFDDHLYLSHTWIESQKNSAPKKPFPYHGCISRLLAPSFTQMETVVSGLPVSNHDHGSMGIEFDNNGNLFINIGGQTNAGISHNKLGSLQESPLSGSMVCAKIYMPGFNGKVEYVHHQLATPLNDQTDGQDAKLSNKVKGVSVFVAGLRNPFDLVFTTRGELYAVDNGPNVGYGQISTGANTQISKHAGTPDKLCGPLKEGQFLGHPNRNRGRTDPRQNIYHSLFEAPNPSQFTQSINLGLSPTVGMTEYRSMSFGGSAFRTIFIAIWKSSIIAFNPDTKTLTKNYSPLTGLTAIDIVFAPAGSIIGVNWANGNGNLLVAKPDDDFLKNEQNPFVTDIFPWRCAPSLNCNVIISGKNLGGASSVVVAGAPVTVTKNTGNRIEGKLGTPPSSFVDGKLKSVKIQIGPKTARLADAFVWTKLAF